jgi:DNA-binding LacI/PurR family transcriptional regulator
MADIARLAGVSVSTVSRTLAGNPLIAAETREQVLAVAASQGYVLNQSARNLRLKRTGVVAVVIPLGHEAGQPVSDPFFLEMVGHLADEVSARGYDILLTRVANPTSGWLGRLVQSGRADGLIVIGQSDQHQALNDISAQYLPLVVWGCRMEPQSYCTIGVDNVRGTELAVEHLLAVGRRRIGFLGASPAPEFAQRLQGYRTAMARAGLTDEAALVAPTQLSSASVKQPLLDLLTRNPDLDGLVCAADVVAIAAMHILAANGLSVPKDVSVVGFDDIRIAALVHPSLTTVRQDFGLGAKLMVERLFQRIAGEPAASVVMDSVLVLRQSTGCAGS